MQTLSVETYEKTALWFDYQSKQKIAYWDSALRKVNRPSAQNNQAVEDTISETDVAKPVILFLHGFPSASWDWHAQWSVLSHSYRCIAFDMLGFGLSDKPRNHTYTVLEQADIASVLCRKLGVDHCHVIAHDYGVSVAQQLLSIVSSGTSVNVDSVCFLNGGLFAHLHRPLFTQKLLHGAFGPLIARLMSKSTLRRSFTKIFGKKTPPSDLEIDTLWRLIQRKDGHVVMPKLLDYLDERKLHAARWLSHMQASKVPLGFINGTQDPISGAHMLAHFKKMLPNSPTKALEVGHYPQLESKEEVSALLGQFLRQASFD